MEKMEYNEERISHLEEVSAMDVPNWFVCVMGMGVTFIGLICLIFITQITGAVCRVFAKEPEKKAEPAPVIPAAGEMPNRGELIAAVSAAVAEELGTEVSAIRILSFRKVS